MNKMKYTKEERLERARLLREQGYNCAQSVIMVFDDVTGLDEALAARITSGLGSGVASGELCGVANAMALAQGTRQSAEAKGKAASAKVSRRLLDEFASRNDGRLRCADLKGKPGIRPCNELVLQGVEILHDYFRDKESAESSAAESSK